MTVRVLMIDDDVEDCEIVEEYLAEADGEYQFESVTDYEAARELMLSQSHDVYLLDHRMGPVRGVDMLGDLREKGFVRPVVLCSGDVDRDAKMDAALYGVSDMLDKRNLSPVALENSIKFALERGNRPAR